MSGNCSSAFKRVQNYAFHKAIFNALIRKPSRSISQSPRLLDYPWLLYLVVRRIGSPIWNMSSEKIAKQCGITSEKLSFKVSSVSFTGTIIKSQTTSKLTRISEILILPMKWVESFIYVFDKTKGGRSSSEMLSAMHMLVALLQLH